MKIKNKMALLSFIMSLMLLISFIPSIRGDYYSFLMSLEAGATYEWEVTTLTTLGSVSASYLNFGPTEVLKQGDKINVTLTKDVNATAFGDPWELFTNNTVGWAEFYLNGEFITNDTRDIDLFYLDWVNIGLDPFRFWFFNEFLLPVSFTNDTGTYDNFVILHNTYPQGTGELKTDSAHHAYSQSIHLKEKITCKLSKDTWSVKRVYSEVLKEKDYTDPDNWDTTDRTLDITTELRFNVATGLLVYVDHEYAWHQIYSEEGSTEDEVREVKFVLESTQLTIKAPYNWAYVLIGLLTIGIIVLWRKKN